MPRSKLVLIGQCIAVNTLLNLGRAYGLMQNYLTSGRKHVKCHVESRPMRRERTTSLPSRRPAPPELPPSAMSGVVLVFPPRRR